MGKRLLAIAGLTACLAIAAAGCGSSSSNSSSTSGAAAQSGSTASGSTSTSTPTTSTPTTSSTQAGGSTGSGTSSSGSSNGATNSNGAPLGSNTSSAGDNSIQTYGSEAQGGDKAAVVAAMRSFFRAIAAPDYAKICAEITSQNRTALQQFAKLKHNKGQGCAALLPKLLVRSPATTAAARKAASATVAHVRIGGDNAFVLFRPVGGPLSYFVMKQENGAWKSTSLATGTPLSPAAPPAG